jgi:beta-lactamase class A
MIFSRLDRRQFMGAGFVGSAAMFAARPTAAAPARAPALDLDAACRAVERDSGGRYGLAIHDSANGRRFAWRGDERFAMASTFKFLLAAAVLARVDAGSERLARALRVAKADAIGVSPFVKMRAGGTATIGELCRAIMIFSDNGAANLLLPAVGGPAGLTAWLRGIGDPITRLDRNEPSMSEDLPGEIRDTTHPAAMLASMEKILVGEILSPASRARLAGWMIANTTGDLRLRAGLPKVWKIGDKTGSSSAGSANDIAIVWPTHGVPPLLIVSLLSRPTSGYERAGMYHAAVARAIAAAF